MKKYFPFLKSKGGELVAISQLSQAQKDNIAPVIELLPNSIEAVKKTLMANWAFKDNQILIDPKIFDESEDLSEVEELFEIISLLGVNAVPVVNISSSENYIEYVKNYIDEFKEISCNPIRKKTLKKENDKDGFGGFD